MAAVPAGAFLIAVSMLERRATLQHRDDGDRPDGVPPAPGAGSVPPVSGAARPVLAGEGALDGRDGAPLALPPAPVPDDGEPPLAGAARRAAAEHYQRFGQPITRDALRARLGVSNQAASELLRQIRQDSEGR